MLRWTAFVHILELAANDSGFQDEIMCAIALLLFAPC